MRIRLILYPQLFTKRSDKEWSLVDCASFVVMRQRGIIEAFTTDHHFEQAGFVYLLKAWDAGVRTMVHLTAEFSGRAL